MRGTAFPLLHPRRGGTTGGRPRTPPRRVLAAAAVILALHLVSQTLSREAFSMPATKPSDRAWDKVRSWACQHQEIDLAKLAASGFDLLVIDYSADGSDATRFSRQDVQRLQTAGRPRLVLAYLSVGEAETYRYYWKKHWRPGVPAWLGPENPEWKGNFKVKYWDPDWQRVLFGGPDSYLDKIMDAGFDGVYLDIIDAYEYWEEKGQPRARERMIELVGRLAEYSRKTRGDASFGIFPQNGEELLTDAGYLDVVTGIAKEDAYFGYEHPDDSVTPPEVTRRVESFLDRAVGHGRLVLTLDYCREAAHVREAYRRSRGRGYRPYCSVRDLDRLIVNGEVDPPPLPPSPKVP